MTLDEIEQLARYQVSGDASADTHVKQLLRADKIARFVLDVLPVVKAAEIVARRIEPTGDWACKQCRPYSDMLIAGFQCGPHELLAAIDTWRKASTK